MKKRELCHLNEPQSQNQRKRKERQVLEPCKRTKKAIGHEDDGDTNSNTRPKNCPKRLGKRNKRVRNQRTNRDHPNYSIVEIGQNTEECPSDLRRLAITQTPVKDHQLTLVCKIRKK